MSQPSVVHCESAHACPPACFPCSTRLSLTEVWVLPALPAADPCNTWAAAGVGGLSGWKQWQRGHFLCATGLTMHVNHRRSTSSGRKKQVGEKRESHQKNVKEQQSFRDRVRFNTTDFHQNNKVEFSVLKCRLSLCFTCTKHITISWGHTGDHIRLGLEKTFLTWYWTCSKLY